MESVDTTNQSDSVTTSGSEETKYDLKEIPILSEIRENFSKTCLNNEPVKSGSGVSAASDEEFHSASEGSDSEEEYLHKLSDRVSTEPFIKERNQSEGEEEVEASQHSEEEDKTKEEREIEARKRLEDKLSPQQLEEKKSEGQTLKNKGNVQFRAGEYDDAVKTYTQALEVCPLCFEKDRAVLFSNRAACKMKKSLNEEAIRDSTRAIDLHPQYVKAVLRRAELYEKTEKLDEALKDYEKVVELDPSHHQSRAACMKLAEQIKERNEKMKEEMMGKLKDLGNMVLRPFGLSTNNFQMQQDPNTGGYSINFNQNPGNGGS